MALDCEPLADVMVDRCREVPFYCKVIPSVMQVRNLLDALTSFPTSQKQEVRKQIVDLWNRIDSNFVNTIEL